MDSLLFVEGFNGCDLSVTRSIVAENLDFYHDQSGIQDKPQFMAAIEQNICSSHEQKPIRKLVSGTVKVFPLYRDGTLYGAIQSGRHEFYIQKSGNAPYKTSIAQFTHVWVLDGEAWRLTEVLSYDHQDPPRTHGTRFDAGRPAPFFAGDDAIPGLLRQHRILGLTSPLSPSLSRRHVDH
jgi:hypothetical protein